MNSTSVLVSSADIQKKVTELGKKLATDYAGKDPLLIGVLTGAYIFMADLSRALWNADLKDFEVDFVGVSSYGNSTESSKQPVLKKDVSKDISGRHIILVEDIIDTGWTVSFLLKHLKEKNPLSIKTVALLSKPEKREVEVPIDYLGFEIGPEWVEGYGLDGGRYGRGCPDVRVVKPA